MFVCLFLTATCLAWGRPAAPAASASPAPPANRLRFPPLVPSGQHRRSARRLSKRADAYGATRCAVVGAAGYPPPPSAPPVRVHPFVARGCGRRLVGGSRSARLSLPLALTWAVLGVVARARTRGTRTPRAGVGRRARGVLACRRGRRGCPARQRRSMCVCVRWARTAPVRPSYLNIRAM